MILRRVAYLSRRPEAECQSTAQHCQVPGVWSE